MLLTAERVLVAGELHRDVVLDVDHHGRIAAVGDQRSLGAAERVLDGVIVPGRVEAHVNPAVGIPDDLVETFDAEVLRALARHRFIEMLRAGVTAVGAVLEVHHQPDGSPYRDPTTMADALALAARDAGIRICLLRSVRLRGDFERPAEGAERRGRDPSIDLAADRVTFTARRLAGYRDARLTTGVAVHSLATVPPDALIALKTRVAHLPLHVGASLGLAETLTCQTLYGIGPVELLVRAGIVDGCTTLVGVSGLGRAEVELLAQSGGIVLSETADVVAALEAAGLPVVTNGPVEIDRLELNNGVAAQALALRAGRIARGYWADLIVLDSPREPFVVREVVVGGEVVVKDGQHPLEASSAAAFVLASSSEDSSE